MEALKETQLYCPFAYIDGSWVAADSGEQIEVVNPATGETFGTVPYGTSVTCSPLVSENLVVAGSTNGRGSPPCGGVCRTGCATAAAPPMQASGS